MGIAKKTDCGEWNTTLRCFKLIIAMNQINHRNALFVLLKPTAKRLGV